MSADKELTPPSQDLFSKRELFSNSNLWTGQTLDIFSGKVKASMLSTNGRDCTVVCNGKVGVYDVEAMLKFGWSHKREG